MIPCKRCGGMGHPERYCHRPPVPGFRPSMNTVPNKPKTPIRGVRVPDEEWHPAQKKAKAEGETVTDVVRRALRDYVEPSK